MEEDENLLHGLDQLEKKEQDEIEVMRRKS